MAAVKRHRRLPMADHPVTDVPPRAQSATGLQDAEKLVFRQAAQKVRCKRRIAAMGTRGHPPEVGQAYSVRTSQRRRRARAAPSAAL
jgi:hypothetical protein